MTFPVVSADSDHRLLSGNPSGCAEMSQLYKCLCEPWVNDLFKAIEPRRGRARWLAIRGSPVTNSLSPLRGSPNL